MGLVLGMESGILSLPSPSFSVHPVPLLKTNKTNKTNQTKKLFSVLKNNFFFSFDRLNHYQDFKLKIPKVRGEMERKQVIVKNNNKTLCNDEILLKVRN